MRPRFVSSGVTGAVVCVVLSSNAAAEPSGQGARAPSALDWNAPVYCLSDAKGQQYRVQFNTKQTNKVLVADNATSSGHPLERVQSCQPHPHIRDMEQLRSSGATLTTARAEAPDGWYRDASGRVFQVNFDLQRRFYVGAGWHPLRALEPPSTELGRAYLDMGLQASWLASPKTRHTITALEGRVTLDDLEAEGQLLRYDVSHASDKPLLRLTTFFGEPARHDLNMDVGVGVRVLGIHHRPHRVKDRLDVEYGELHGTWYVWQSPDLYNHVRWQLGAGGEGWHDPQGTLTPRYAVTPNTELSYRFGLDRAGFHYLDGTLHASTPILVSDEGRGSTYRRAGARSAYEVIVLAVNDQPISLRFEGRLSYRDDLPDDAAQVEASGLAGLRFSFWAPARENAGSSQRPAEQPQWDDD